jgi:hypothetical protein
MIKKGTAEYFWSRLDGDNINECWNFHGATTNFGYGKLTFNKQWWMSHRLAWTLVNGPIPENMWVLHRCDNPSCCNPQHLFLGTYQINVTDCVLKERNARGEKHGRSKLTVAEVRHIKLSNLPGAALSEMYKIAPGQISAIRSGKKWKHI